MIHTRDSWVYLEERSISRYSSFKETLVWFLLSFASWYSFCTWSIWCSLCSCSVNWNWSCSFRTYCLWSHFCSIFSISWIWFIEWMFDRRSLSSFCYIRKNKYKYNYKIKILFIFLFGFFRFRVVRCLDNERFRCLGTGFDGLFWCFFIFGLRFFLVILWVL